MTAYLYMRFSTIEQSAGDSERRQLTLAKNYASDNNIVLSDRIFFDKGISAFAGKNADSGELGKFLDAVDRGDIPKGSILLVESADRLSRNSLSEADNLFSLILSKGITIITLSDKKVYSPESKDDLTDRIVRMVTAARARNESEEKSRRGKEVWKTKNQKAVEHKIPKTAMCPSWLVLQDGKFIIKNDVAEVLKVIIAKYMEGYGYQIIAKHMNHNYPPIPFNGRTPKRWYETSIKQFINNPAIIGTLVTRNRKTKEIIEEIYNYYPAIITYAEWQQIKNQKSKRTTGTGGRSATLVNIFSHLAKCGYCGGTMIRYNGSSTTRKWVAMVCGNGKSGATKCGSKTWNIVDLEYKILKSITELDINKILSKKDEQNNIIALKNTIAKLEYDLVSNRQKQNNIVEAIADGAVFKILQDKLIKLVDDASIIENEISQYKKDLDDATGIISNTQKSLDNIKDLIDNINKDDNRKKINVELKKIIDKIILFIPEKEFRIMYKSGVTKQNIGNENHLVVIDAPKDVDVGGKTLRLREVKRLKNELE